MSVIEFFLLPDRLTFPHSSPVKARLHLLTAYSAWSHGDPGGHAHSTSLPTKYRIILDITDLVCRYYPQKLVILKTNAINHF